MSKDAEKWIQSLGLQPLQGEGGYWGSCGRSELRVQQNGRDFAAHSSIYYLLTAEQPVNFAHRLESDDVHILLEGGPVDYFLFFPDGRLEKHTLGRDLEAGQKLVVTMPGGGWKALKLCAGAEFALMANVLTPEWTPDRVSLAAPEAFLAKFTGRAEWATRSFLESLLSREPLAE